MAAKGQRPTRLRAPLSVRLNSPTAPADKGPPRELSAAAQRTSVSGMSECSPTGVTATQPFITAQESVPSLGSLQAKHNRAGCGKPEHIPFISQLPAEMARHYINAHRQGVRPQ